MYVTYYNSLLYCKIINPHNRFLFILNYTCLSYIFPVSQLSPLLLSHPIHLYSQWKKSPLQWRIQKGGRGGIAPSIIGQNLAKLAPFYQFWPLCPPQLTTLDHPLPSMPISDQSDCAFVHTHLFSYIVHDQSQSKLLVQDTNIPLLAMIKKQKFCCCFVCLLFQF